MSALRLLTLCHNHPSLHPGGTEIFALDLFRELRRSGAVEGLFLGCANRVHREPRPGASFQGVGGADDEAILWAGRFDLFHLSRPDLGQLADDLGEVLDAVRPDIVHLHHTLLLGVEALAVIRRLAPRARLVLTLHDYYPICAQDGVMVTARDHRLCHRASPEACHRCLPEHGADRFLLRERHIKGLFGLVDAFVAPSDFLRERYIDWGLPAERITVIRNGLAPAAPEPERPRPPGRVVFGLFGNVNPYKGVTVALEAARRLRDAGRTGFELRLHGAAPFEDEAFRAAVETGIRELGGHVTRSGEYRRQDLPGLLAGVDWVLVPSIWWENAPLVIQEAFRAGRPVICSGVGGMAEMTRDGVDALHVRPGDPGALSAAMARALAEPGLRDRLAAAIPPVPTLADSARDHLALYRGEGGRHHG